MSAGLPSAADLQWIRQFRRAIALDAAKLHALVAEELGKPEFETLTSEVAPLLVACRWHERYARRVLAPRRVRGGSIWQIGQRHEMQRVALGRVAIIATWNYPLQLLGVQLLQAIACGNSVVVKPSERAPRTQLRLLELALESGLERERLRWTEPTREAGELLLREERFDHVVFTGSTRVGRMLATTLAQTLTPSTLELSGHDSALVLSDADARLAADSIHFALTLNRGRTCMAPRRAIVHRRQLAAFVQRLTMRMRERPLVPALSSEEHAQLEELAVEAERRGARRLLPPSPASAVVLAECPVDCALASGEHFGPALAVIVAESDAEVLALHARHPQRLATSLFSRDVRAARRLAAQLGSSVVTVNDAVIPTGHPGASLGGAGPSGWGLTRGEQGLLALSRPIFVSRTARRVRAPLAPPDPGTQRALARFIRWYYA